MSISMPKTKLEEQNIFTCTHEGCVKTFCRAEELNQHLLVGDCHLKLEKERSDDLVCISKERTGDNILEKGWGLKEGRKCARFSKKQKSYRENKFNIGLKSGRKEDPVSVSEEMISLNTEDGEKVFAYEELLTAQQIAGFFRECARSPNQNVQEVPISNQRVFI